MVMDNKDIVKQGSVNLIIDEIVSCLKDSETSELKETVVFKIESRSYLKKFNEKNGWHINWFEIPADVEVYALALKDDNKIQGLVAIKNDVNSKAVYIHWVCAAPHNVKETGGNQKYIGVGGHLFAIAIDKSIEFGYNGMVHGFASSEKLLNHYIDKLGAEHLGMLHQYQFVISEENAKKLLEVYNYEWNNS